MQAIKEIQWSLIYLHGQESEFDKMVIVDLGKIGAEDRRRKARGDGKVCSKDGGMI